MFNKQATRPHFLSQIRRRVKEIASFMCLLIVFITLVSCKEYDANEGHGPVKGNFFIK